VSRDKGIEFSDHKSRAAFLQADNELKSASALGETGDMLRRISAYLMYLKSSRRSTTEKHNVTH
jgi:hypothetical protein